MNVNCLVVGQLQTNCYLLSCSETGEAIIIDPGDDGDFINRRILDLRLKPKSILATHGHFDHVLAVMELKLAFKIPFLIHKDDLFLLKRVKRTAEHFLGYPADLPPTVDQYLAEGDLVTFGEERLKVIATPGHTPGGVSFYGSTPHLRGVSRYHLGGERVLFSGDTLFCQGIGRSDFSYCSYENLLKSLRKVFKLPDRTGVYPGHGPETNLLAEKSFFQRWA